MERRGDIALEWVLMNGTRKPVTSFAGLAVGKRPAVTCPQCGRTLTLKLGRIRRHHAAHAPGAVCAATNPETALHINAKLHIAAELEVAIGGGRPLVTSRCCATPGCIARHNTEWIRDWDAVLVEMRVADSGAHRVPDIVLLRQGTPIAAIEVLVSHSVDADKAASLAALEVPWVEVRATEDLYAGASAWRVTRPLPLEIDSARGPWRCVRHEVSYAVDESRARAARVREPPTSRDSHIVIAARLVDVYQPDGASRRLRYSVVEDRFNGELKSVRLVRGRDTTVGIFHARAAEPIRVAYEEDIRRLESAKGTIVDSPMKWARGMDAELLASRSLQHPRRYRYETVARAWTMAPAMEPMRWPDLNSVEQAGRVRDSIESAVRLRSRSPQAGLEPRTKHSAP